MPVDPLSLEPGANGAAVQIVNDIYRRVGILERNGGGTTTTSSSSGTVADATTTVKGKLKLAGDFAGTADSPRLNSAAVTQVSQLGLGAAASTGRLTFADGTSSTADGVQFGTTTPSYLHRFGANQAAFTNTSGSSLQVHLNALGAADNAHLLWRGGGTSRWRMSYIASTGEFQTVDLSTGRAPMSLAVNGKLSIRTRINAASGPSALADANLDPGGGQDGLGTNIALDTSRTLDGRYINSTSSSSVSRVWNNVSNSINGTNGTRARSGTESTGTLQSTGTTVVGTGSNFPSDCAGKKINAIRDVAGVATDYTATIASWTSLTSITLTAPGFVDKFGNTVDAPAGSIYSIDPDRITVDWAAGGYGSTYSRAFQPWFANCYMNTLGTFNVYNGFLTMNDAGSSAGGNAGVDGYGEAFIHNAHITTYRQGALVGNEFKVTLNSGGQGRTNILSALMEPVDNYASYFNDAIFGPYANTSWQLSGNRGVSIHNVTGTVQAGTGLWISDNGGGWARAMVVNRSSSMTPGTDVFCIDGTKGWVGITDGAPSTGLVPTTNHSGTISSPFVVSAALGTNTRAIALNNTTVNGVTSILLKNSGDGTTGTARSELMFAHSVAGVTTNNFSVRTLPSSSTPTFQIRNEASGNIPLQVRSSDDTVRMNVAAANPMLLLSPSTWDAGGVGGSYIRLNTLLSSAIFAGGYNGTRTGGNRTNVDAANGAGATFFTPAETDANYTTYGSFSGFGSTLTNAEVTAAYTITGVTSTGSPTTTVTAANGLVASDQVYITGTGIPAIDNHVWIVASATAANFVITLVNSAAYAPTTPRAQKLDYHEASGFVASMTHNARGGLSVGTEAGMHYDRPGRIQGLSAIMSPSTGGEYATFTGTDGTNTLGTSTWTQTGARAFWARNNSATLNAGSGIVVDDNGGGWQYAFLYNQNALADALGTPQFAVSGLTATPGYVALGNTSASFPARLTFATSTAASGGIQFGTTTPVNFFRSGAAAATLQGTLRAQDGIIGTDGSVPVTGAISPSWPDIVTAGNATIVPVIGTFYIVSIEVHRNQTFSGAAFMVGGTAPGAEKAVVYMWDANGTLVANSALTPAANNIQTGCAAGPSGATGTHRWCQLAFTGAYAAKGPSRYFIGVQVNTATTGIPKMYGASYAGLAKSQAGTFTGGTATSAPIATLPTTFAPSAAPMMYLY